MECFHNMGVYFYNWGVLQLYPQAQHHRNKFSSLWLGMSSLSLEAFKQRLNNLKGQTVPIHLPGRVAPFRMCIVLRIPPPPHGVLGLSSGPEAGVLIRPVCTVLPAVPAQAPRNAVTVFVEGGWAGPPSRTTGRALCHWGWEEQHK